MAHFPECGLPDYGGIDISKVREHDYVELPEQVDNIKLLARRLKIYLILGSHNFDGNPDKPKNSLYIINYNRAIDFCYDKRILAGFKGAEDHVYNSAGA